MNKREVEKYNQEMRLRVAKEYSSPVAGWIQALNELNDDGSYRISDEQVNALADNETVEIA